MSTQSAQKHELKIGPLVRSRRRQLSMTLQALGQAAGVSVGYLSQIERDNATPSLGTLAQIASALNVKLDYFVAMPQASDSLSRAGERVLFSLDGSSIHYEQTGADLPGHELSSFIVHVPPGHRSETVSHEGEEVIYILDGEIRQVLDGEEMTLRAGDSLHYRGNRPHAWSNPGDRPARLLWVGTLTVFHMAGRADLDHAPAADAASVMTTAQQSTGG
ncbi:MULTISPECIES: cupin domain-containing protein [unclassified Roseitalea]|uniref:helix-turn-helix domain-containing protein n=1 Tax=unclassified Roseitalea TaxID=2639107 RepID=UPI00273D3330|nr:MULTISPECIES: cupin domain-containing protein [unclassified Roseitalea]